MLPLCSSAPGKHLPDRLIRSEVAMVSIIHQKVMFSTSPRELFNIYLDSKKHGAAIDDRVSIGRKVGARFTAF